MSISSVINSSITPEECKQYILSYFYDGYADEQDHPFLIDVQGLVAEEGKAIFLLEYDDYPNSRPDRFNFTEADPKNPGCSLNGKIEQLDRDDLISVLMGHADAVRRKHPTINLMVPEDE